MCLDRPLTNRGKGVQYSSAAFVKKKVLLSCICKEKRICSQVSDFVLLSSESELLNMVSVLIKLFFQNIFRKVVRLCQSKNKLKIKPTTIDER